MCVQRALLSNKISKKIYFFSIYIFLFLFCCLELATLGFVDEKSFIDFENDLEEPLNESVRERFWIRKRNATLCIAIVCNTINTNLLQSFCSLQC